MLSIRRFYLTFVSFFCRIKWYKGICVLLCGGILLCGGCRKASPPPKPTPSLKDEEMRGVWLSYIELDAMLAADNPEREIAQAMQACADQGLNTVFFHVRAFGTAYFRSTVWPQVTTAIDPLACALREAHRRGLQLHAWINPYRIGEKPADTTLAFEKGGVWYYDPSQPAVRQSLLDGVREILANYDVDGIHFDDYFYPAGMNPQGEPFELVPQGMEVTAWRQTQVDALVSGVYGLCRGHDKAFGVSPMADHRRAENEGHANVRRWMTEAGYIDYICPQLYVGFRHQSKPFLPLLAEWVALPRRAGVELYIGLALYKVGLTHDPYAGSGAAEWATDEDIIPKQIEAVRDVTDGYVLFRYGNLIEQK